MPHTRGALDAEGQGRRGCQGQRRSELACGVQQHGGRGNEAPSGGLHYGHVSKDGGSCLASGNGSHGGRRRRECFHRGDEEPASSSSCSLEDAGTAPKSRHGQLGRESRHGDSLSHEIERRPNIRGTRSGPDPASWSRGNGNGAGASRGDQGCGKSDALGGSASYCQGTAQELAPGIRADVNERSEEGFSEHELFAASLRSGDGEGGWSVDGYHKAKAGKGGSLVVGRRSIGKPTPPRRPDWNSDTTAVASLGDGRMAHVTHNSPAAIKVRYTGVLSTVGVGGG